MKTLTEYVNESIFNINPNLSEEELLKLISQISKNRNETDGTKDAYGNPLKKGDVILIPCPGDKNGNMMFALYEEPKGKFIIYKYIGDPRYKLDFEIPRTERIACWKVAKYNL